MLFLLFSAADTLMVRQVPPVRTGFEQVVFVAAGLAQVVTLVVVVLLAVIFFRMWKAQQAMQEQLERLSAKVDPMLQSATAAAENVRVLTDVVRKDAVAAAEALTEATTRVRDSVGGIADRIDEFGALLARVHAKADAVVDVAGAAMETIKWGARTLGPRPPRPRGRAEAKARPDELKSLGAYEEDHDAPVRDEPVRDEPVRDEPVRDEPVRDEPVRDQPVRDEPVRLEPAGDEPARAAAARDEQLRLGDESEDDSPYAEHEPAPRPGRRRRRRRRGGGGPPPG